MATNTSITVQFITPEDEVDEDGNIVQSISAELDAERNDNQTQFLFGTTAYFKTFRVPADLNIELIESAGVLRSFLYSGTDEIEDEAVTFTMSNTGSVSRPIAGGSFSSEWVGQAPTPVATPTVNGSQVRLNREALGVLFCNYNSNYNGHSIYLEQPTPSRSPFPVLIYIRAAA